MAADRQHAHQLLDQLAPGQLAAVLQLLEVMVEDSLNEEDRQAVARSREWFAQHPEGIPFEQVVTECGFTMDDIRNRKGK